MEPTRFDQMSKAFAIRRMSRRAALVTGGAGIAATSLATRLSAAAQDAAQDASPEAATPVATAPDAAREGAEFLFVQPFDGGTWTAKTGEEGTYTLSLSGAAASTIYFSDRPQRIVGLAPTQKFLNALGFMPANPPNAAIVVTQEGAAGQDILVIELINPVYEAKAGTLVYDAHVITDYNGPGLAFLAQQQDDFKLPASFKGGSLFIDDCGDGTVTCIDPYNSTHVVGTLTGIGFCWNWSMACCELCCNGCDFEQMCADQFGAACTYNQPDTVCSYTLNQPTFGC